MSHRFDANTSCGYALAGEWGLAIVLGFFLANVIPIALLGLKIGNLGGESGG